MRILINFLLRRTRENNEGKAPVYVRFTVKSKRVDLSTGIFINPNHWDASKQRVNEKTPNSYAINQRLDRLITEIQDIYNQLKSNGQEITATSIKNILLDTNDSKGILTVFDYYLESILSKLGKGYAMETYKHYKSSRKRLAEFIKNQYKCTDYPLNSINYKFLDTFDIYLKQKYNVHKNTAWNYHKHLRRVLNLSVSMDYILKNPYNKFKVGLEEIKITDLKPLVFDRIFSLKGKEEFSRKEICIGVYTRRYTADFEIIGSIDPSIIYNGPMPFEPWHGLEIKWPLCGKPSEKLGREAYINWERENDEM